MAERPSFQSGSIDNTAGKIAGLIAGRIIEGGVSGSRLRPSGKVQGEIAWRDGRLALGNFKFGASTGEIIPAGTS